ncbi:MAG: AMP-binding protein [Eubacterium sp.]|nr:AMP-binding protein [Eubacterium sp.]
MTGTTGFLGTEIVSEIMQTTDAVVYGLVRAASYSEAVTVLLNLWYRRSELKDNIGSRIIPVTGDIAETNLGMSNADRKRLIHSTDYIIHTAALTGINHCREQFWNVNVTGTKNVLNFAEEIQSDHTLKLFAYISTAYTAGKRKGLIKEDFPVNSGFSSFYEESKFEGELLAIKAMKRFPVSIFRPGQIVGDSRTGYVKSFNTLYYPLKLYLKGQINTFPIRKSMRINMIPVDYAARAVVRITLSGGAEGKIFHLTAPHSVQPTAEELICTVRKWAEKNLNIRLKKPLFLSVPFLEKIGAHYNLSKHKRFKKNTFANMVSLAPYFSENKIFDIANTESFMGEYSLDLSSYLPKLLNYAADRSFLNDNGRTVFEQIMFFFNRRNAPVKYYDVTAEGIAERNASYVSEQIKLTLKALQALGIGLGSKVAVSGINSVSYFALDTAIGLSGAVSVPLYYTTPADELDELLEKSKVQYFFVGDIRILSHISQMKFKGSIISFAENAALSYDSRLISWEQFLSLGKDRSIIPVKVSYNDRATLRYTSGTTGSSKAVTFTHAQLRWMAETMASLLSFKSRTKPAVYLSFLPMSHVVEGILGAYTPYYLGSPVSLYFLNDFNRLAEILPKVRPTIFFSVPRFYEKLWDRLAETGFGKLYISAENPLIKSTLGHIIKKILLKKAGLDRCSQLIVGSAPVSQKLLENFRELGIEIHNAYGLTEAPLITLNRQGENDISTVGTPLPETNVIFADDGEIMVSGPQVAGEYDGGNSAFLHTGDLGDFTEKGHLQIIGRKKEILINSYGKNINLQKVETLLRDIPEISEAVLIGEKKPYCTALLWQENNSVLDEKTLSAAVRAVNEKLSHPEQIKRYALMADPLKISSGELTPNLKIRRNNIAEIHKQTIDGLYAAKAISAGRVIFIGVL